MRGKGCFKYHSNWRVHYYALPHLTVEILDARVPELVFYKVGPVVNRFTAFSANKRSTSTNWLLFLGGIFSNFSTNVNGVWEIRVQSSIIFLSEVQLDFRVINIFMLLLWLYWAIPDGGVDPLQILFLGNNTALAELNSRIQIAKANQAQVAGEFYSIT